MEAIKILVSGDVEGNFDQLFKRVEKVNKKAGPFEALFCVGSFFSSSEKSKTEWLKYENKQAKAPLPTYVLGANKPEVTGMFSKSCNGYEMAENITYLGRKGVMNMMSGLQVAYLSGIEQESSGPSEAHSFAEQDINELAMPLVSNSSFKGVDILITSQWPRNVEKHAVKPEGPGSDKSGSRKLAALTLSLQPRYHFAGLEDVYYERAPYRNHQVLKDKQRHVTRFISLASVANIAKKKYLYAFNIVPMSKLTHAELVVQPPDVTECPFQNISTERRKEPQEADMSNQYFFSTDQPQASQKRQRDHQGGSGSRKPRKHPKPSGPCWFCLGSPEVEKHLVVSVGITTYLALAKGGLVPDHVMILPIGHFQSQVDLPQDVSDEISKYKKALSKYFRSRNKSYVIFERNFKSQHLQLQVVPIENQDDIDIKDIKEALLEYSMKQDIEVNEIPVHSDLKQIVSLGAPYFYVELDGGEKLLHRIKKFFPLQFGREALACPALLNMPDRANWKSCSISKEEESEHAALFRKQFKEYDFNL
ncbi:CWF19-like protein 1 [Anneissia japonica]|uniref:CWF19-like protein 1 n=1 Tax=Anneissia japonica TaxID=1529436 RepID=UPI001425A3EA|nr:CWF19-like protein 1 [Anneissia japonica]